MKTTARIRFYLWVGLASILLDIAHLIVDDAVPFAQRAINETWQGLYLISIVCYLFFEYTLPRLSWRKPFKSIFLILGSIMLWSLGMYLWRAIGIGLHIYTSFAAGKTVANIMSNQTGSSIGGLFFFGIIRHINDHIVLKRTAQRLQIEKQAAELNYLKSQTNPHFLFNTLNNIYSLSRDKSDLAPESILRLSKILRYMLYETSGKFIAIEQEIKIIDDYLSLEKLRYDESLRVNFSHDIEDMKQALPPLLLIPLVENAFKHGVSETTNRPFVDIHLSVKLRQLQFLVRNSTGDSNAERTVKENIGLSNLRRQLELQYTDFKLDVQQNRNVFIASLIINLASHV